jgi:outer membrane protein assembly factor BamB
MHSLLKCAERGRVVAGFLGWPKCGVVRVENLFRLRVEAGESPADRLTFVDDGGPARESSLAVLVQWRDPVLRPALQSLFDAFVNEYRQADTIVSPGSFLERLVQALDAAFGDADGDTLEQIDFAVALCCGRGLYLLHSSGFTPHCELDGNPQPLVSSMRVRVKDLSPSGMRGGHTWSEALVERLRLLRVFFEDDDRATLWLQPRDSAAEFSDDPFADDLRLVVEKEAADATAGIGAALDSGWPDLEASTRGDRRTLSYVAVGLVVVFFGAAVFGMWRWQRGSDAGRSGAETLFSEAVDASLESRSDNARVSADVVSHGERDAKSRDDHDGEADEIAVMWSKSHRDWVTSSPRAVRDRVVYGCRDGHLYALSRDGQVAWDYPSGAGIGATPAVADGRVFCGNYAGRAFAVRDKDGRELWTADLGARIVGSPAVDGKRVFFVTQGGDVVALRQKDGRVEWRQSMGGKLRAAPLAAGDHLYVPGGGNDLVCYEQDSGEVRWSYDAGSNVTSSPLAADGRLVFGCKDGTVHAIAAKDGTALWTLRTKGPVQGTPALGDETIYFGSGDRRLYAVRLETGDVAWAFPTKAAILASPSVNDGRVYITAYDKHTYVVDAENGREIAKLRLKAPIYSSPLVVAGRIYCGSNDGTLYCMSDVR